MRPLAVCWASFTRPWQQHQCRRGALEPSREGPEAWRKRESCGGGVEEGCCESKLGGADLCGMVTVVTGAGLPGVS